MNRLKVDMSGEAVARRLKEISKLWKLANKLKKTKILGPVEQPGRKPPKKRPPKAPKQETA